MPPHPRRASAREPSLSSLAAKASLNAAKAADDGTCARARAAAAAW